MIKTLRFLAVALGVLGFTCIAAAAAAPFDISSKSFRDGGVMELKYSGNRKESANCLGSNVSPELSWTNPPEGTKSYALFLQDPEGRLGLGVIHWVAYGIGPTVHSFAEGELSVASAKYVLGKSFYEGATTYIGPCPPPTSAAHHYIFTVIATDLEPNALPPGLTLAQLFDKLVGHSKGAASLVGTFKHP
jgi:Raf kinase inhibitor-like YbhB/YbcL family protein